MRRGALFLAASVLLMGAASELSRSAALEILKKDAATAAPINHSVVLSTRCTVGGRLPVPDDVATLERKGLVRVTQSPIDRAIIQQVATEGVNALRGLVPDSCVDTIRATFGGMNALVASGQRDFNVMEISLTDAGRSAGLGQGYVEVPVLKEEPDAIARIATVDGNTRRVEYSVRYVATEAGTRTGLADLAIKRTPSTSRTRLFRRDDDEWRLAPK